MKREAVHHSKMKRLCRKLNLELWQGVGLMESIWHVTARQTPRGDIGKLSDEDIAISIDYHGDERKLIVALIDSGWLDTDKQHRLLVHDWSDHCEDAVHMKIARARLFFIRQNSSGIAFSEAPILSRLTAREREPLREFYENSKISRETTKRAHAVRTDSESVRTDSESVRTKQQSVRGPRLNPALTPPSIPTTTVQTSNIQHHHPTTTDDAANGSFAHEICATLGFHRLSKSDLRFCEDLKQSGTTLESIKAGIIVGKARRLIHESNSGVVDQVKSLRYFASTIEEAKNGLFEPGYVAHTEEWLRRKTK